MSTSVSVARPRLPHRLTPYGNKDCPVRPFCMRLRIGAILRRTTFAGPPDPQFPGARANTSLCRCARRRHRSRADACLRPVGEHGWWKCSISCASIENIDKASRGHLRIARRPELAGDDVLSPSRALVALYHPAHGVTGRKRPCGFSRRLIIFRFRSSATTATRPRSAKWSARGKPGLDSINLDRPDIVYEVVSGALSFRYVPYPGAIDGLARARRGTGAPYSDAGSGDGEEIRGRGYRREHLLFRIEPRMSYVSEEFAASDPDFWGAKR